MKTLKKLSINLCCFLLVFFCFALSVIAQCNATKKDVGALVSVGSDDGQKTPLILIHGIHGTAKDEKLTEINSYWRGFTWNFAFDEYLKSDITQYL